MLPQIWKWRNCQVKNQLYLWCSPISLLYDIFSNKKIRFCQTKRHSQLRHFGGNNLIVLKSTQSTVWCLFPDFNDFWIFLAECQLLFFGRLHREQVIRITLRQQVASTLSYFWPSCKSSCYFMIFLQNLERHSVRLIRRLGFKAGKTWPDKNVSI